MKIKFSQPIIDSSINPNRHSWIAFERGIHSDNFTSVAVNIGVDKFERINDLEFESYEVALAYLKANRMGYV
jgi:hypothetical protein